MQRNENKSNADGTSMDLSYASNVEIVSGAKTVKHGDSGKTLVLKGTAGAPIELPVAKNGFKLKVVVGQAFATTSFTVVAPAATIQGGAIVNSVFVSSANRNTISFVHTAETVGDHIELESDGTNYYVKGVGAAAGSITFTTV
jgi:hypothetical protein